MNKHPNNQVQNKVSDFLQTKNHEPDQKDRRHILDLH